MVDATLFYIDNSQIGDSISSLPDKQKLIFDFPNDLLEGITEYYENRINPQQSVNSEGIRRIFNRDDGLRGRRFELRGRMKKISADIPKLKHFRLIAPTDGLLVHGRFGLDLPSAPFYSISPRIDPDNVLPNGPNGERAFMIGKQQIGYAGISPTKQDFTIELFFGGQHEPSGLSGVLTPE